MKKLIIAGLLSVTSLFSMTAISMASMLEGLSIGLSVSEAGFYGVGTENVDDGGNTGTKKTTEAGAFGESVGSIFIEYNAGPVSVGIDYIPGEIDTPENVNRQGSGTADNTDVINKVQASFENHTTFYFLVPVPILGGTYVKAGAIYADINTNENMPSSSYPNTDTNGWTLGLGYSVEAGSGVSVRLEATAATYDDVSLSEQSANSGEATKKMVEIEDMMSARGTISIVKTF
tara:strand:+ start:559 stop:1254 length:696 start_codon:yes stop_codon:yes gene_type:complete